MQSRPYAARKLKNKKCAARHWSYSMEVLVFIGDYCYLVEADLTESEMSIMIDECYRTSNVQETVLKYGGKIVTCHLMN